MTPTKDSKDLFLTLGINRNGMERAEALNRNLAHPPSMQLFGHSFSLMPVDTSAPFSKTLKTLTQVQGLVERPISFQRVEVNGLSSRKEVPNGKPFYTDSVKYFFEQAKSNYESRSGPYRLYKLGSHVGQTMPYKDIPQCAKVEGPAYYHATSLKSLKEILLSGKVARKDHGVYAGAWVSTIPETAFGSFVLAFNSSIDKAPAINGKYNRLWNRVWIGFKDDIPVNAKTLEFIAVKGKHLNAKSLKRISDVFSKAFGRKIEVRPLDETIKKAADKSRDCGIATPVHIPTEMNEVSLFFKAFMFDM